MHEAVILIAADLPVHPSPGEMLSFLAGGVAVVLAALSFIALCTSSVGLALKLLAPRTPVHASASAGVVADELSEDVAVVIAAAVAVAIQEPHRIHYVRSYDESIWTLGGRMQHHSSHQIQPRDRR
ncbi:MAG: hypothetical protein KF688_04450 [Pirellulales bacterium]|nr:hypothetical protein [Pirellulales bacterium]MBX3434388.1 hypothetical protein [Pirellulales bacterium]